MSGLPAATLGLRERRQLRVGLGEPVIAVLGQRGPRLPAKCSLGLPEKGPAPMGRG